MSLAGRLTVDLGAIAANWRALDGLSVPEVETAAVVKADAYGLGAARVAPALAGAGARTFFVAVPSEGAALRAALGPGPAIYILGGYPLSGEEQALFTAHDLRPVLNAPEQVAAWRETGLAAALQLDTGMNRLGLEAQELANPGTSPSGPRPLPLQGLRRGPSRQWRGESPEEGPGWGSGLTLAMSHLACADEPAHPMNAAQLAEFRQLTQGLGLPLSLAATGGTLLGGEYHFAMTRPGIGLYGGLPFAEARPAVTLELPVLQIREVAPGESVGYGNTWTATRPSRIATLSGGYADGLHRALSGRAKGWIEGTPCPFAGRVSMDLIGLDVTDCPAARPGTMVEILGPHQPVDTLAEAAGTIGYEILTSLGRRYERRYCG